MRTQFVVLVLAACGLYGQSPPKQTSLAFVGRQVTINQPELAEYNYTEGSASVCFDGSPRPQCYTAEKHFGVVSEATPIRLPGATQALFVAVATGGVSGSTIHFALLQPGNGPNLDDLFGSDLEISSQSQHAFWNEPTISGAPIFLTADFAWDLSEAHIDSHRYLISAYLLKKRKPEGFSLYDLDDRYMTVRKYDLNQEKVADIFAAEKPEILARLKRVKAERERQAKAQQ